MIIITGAAGFIGSNLLISLEESGHDNIAVCDWFGEGEKWNNLRKHSFADVVLPEDLLPYLNNIKTPVEAIFHMGAISSTTESRVDLILEQNFAFTLDLWKWCTKTGTRFIYASSAATYGDGSNGFIDNESLEYLQKLNPLNAYAWSKHLFDLQVVRAISQGTATPPQWAGLKFFNVYGPNEYHKGNQKSVLCTNFPDVNAGKPVKLFKSLHPDFPDGEQTRDFIYVKDCCDVMIWLLANPEVSGIFNVGTGKARSFNDMFKSLFKSLDKPEQITYIDMPKELANKYQYFTQANMDKLSNAGYSKPITSLEAGIQDYVVKYLDQPDQYR